MCKLLCGLLVARILDKEAWGDDTLQGIEETNLVDEHGTASLEGGKEIVVGLGVDEGVVDLHVDDEAVLLDAENAGGCFDCQTKGVEWSGEGHQGMAKGLVDLMLTKAAGTS